MAAVLSAKAFVFLSIQVWDLHSVPDNTVSLVTWLVPVKVRAVQLSHLPAPGLWLAMAATVVHLITESGVLNSEKIHRGQWYFFPAEIWITCLCNDLDPSHPSPPFLLSQSYSYISVLCPPCTSSAPPFTSRSPLYITVPFYNSVVRPPSHHNPFHYSGVCLWSSEQWWSRGSPLITVHKWFMKQR